MASGAQIELWQAEGNIESDEAGLKTTTDLIAARQASIGAGVPVGEVIGPILIQVAAGLQAAVP